MTVRPTLSALPKTAAAVLPVPVISIAATSANKTEGNSGTSAFTFTVSRDSGLGASSVSWTLLHATTTETDFSGATSGVVTFADGETSKVITLTVLGDNTIELDGTFGVVLSGPEGATLGTASASGTIVNDDVGSLSISAVVGSRQEGNSGAAAFTYAVTRSTDIGTSTVNWSVAHGTTSAADFSGPTSGSLSFAAGETVKLVTVSAAGDTLIEGNETFSVVLSGATGATLATASAAGTIVDDDLPVLNIASNVTNQYEGTGAAGASTPFSFTVTRSVGTGVSTATWSLVHLTTTAADFVGATSGRVAFAAGETSKVITVNVAADSVIELNENFMLRLSGPIGAVLGTNIAAASTIANDDLPTVSIAATSASVVEGNSGTTPFTFTVTRSSDIGIGSVNWALQHVGTSAADFTGGTSGTVTFAAGETSKLITVTAVGETLVERDEAFNIVLSGASGVVIGVGTASGLVVNDDLPTLSIAATSPLRAEGNSGVSAFTFTVTRSAAIGASSASYAVVLGTATAADFSGALSGAVSFADGETSKTITVGVVADTVIELDETFSVVLTNPVGALLGTASATATIVNDDLPTVSVFATTASVNEGQSGTTPWTFTVSRSSSVGTSAVNWAVAHVGTSDTDFSGATSGVVTFAAGETSKVLTLNVVGDTVSELNEAFNVVLSAPTGALIGVGTASGTVVNDDLPAVGIVATSAAKLEGNLGTTPFTFTVSRTSSVGTGAVNWAVVHGDTNAADFSGATSGTVTFAAGETSKAITLNVVGDTVVEANESFNVVLSSPTNLVIGTMAAMGTILADDLPAISIAAVSARLNEGTGGTTSYSFTVSRSSGLGTSSVGYALVHGTTDAADFSGATSGVVSFAAGETSKVVSLSVAADATIELDENFSVVLTNPVGATLGTASASGTLVNDDLPIVSIVSTTPSQSEGQSGTTAFTFTVTRGSGVGTSSVNWAVSHVGTSTADFTGPTAGTVSFAAGETSKVVTVQVVGDTAVELDERFDVVLSSPSGALLSGATSSASATIVNDDRPTVSITAASADKAEGSSGGTTAFTFTVSRSSGVGTGAVNYALVHGTTTADDFSGATSGTVSFAAGETSKTVTLTVAADTVIEGDETFSVVLSSPVGAVLGTATAAGRIVNDDLPRVSIVATNADQNEGNSGTTPFTFTVTRSVGTGVSSVAYAVVHGTTDAADFSGATSGTVTFAAGETSKVVTLNVVGDTLGESNESFSVALSGAVNASIGTSSAAGLVRNDDSGGTGGINSSVSQVTYISVPAEVTDNIDNLVGGAKWGGAIGTSAQLTYSFTTASSVFSYTGSPPYTALNASQQAAARRAMSLLSAVCNVSFAEVADTAVGAGDIRWTQSQSYSVGTAYAYYPSSAAAGGDIWIGPSSSYSSPVPGTYGDQTFIHELGHALGLDHPHDGSPVPLPGEDQLKYSVMSYKDHATDINDGYGSSYFPTTYMLNDIAALQYLYGINATTNHGDNVYTWAAGSQVYECLWDTGGVDTIDASSQSQSVALDLNGGAWSTIGASYSNQLTQVRSSLGIAYDVVTATVDSRIENAIGTAQADTLVGNAVGNTLTGGLGADTLTGGAGADVFRFVTTAQGGDTLTDFTSGTDRIQVVSANFGALGVGTLAASRFVSGSAPAPLDANAVFLYNPSTGVLSFDSNGTGSGGLTVVATLASGFRTLTAGDIQVVAA